MRTIWRWLAVACLTLSLVASPRSVSAHVYDVSWEALPAPTGQEYLGFRVYRCDGGACDPVHPWTLAAEFPPSCCATTPCQGTFTSPTPEQRVQVNLYMTALTEGGESGPSEVLSRVLDPEATLAPPFSFDVDRCPNTPPGEIVDDGGCSLAQFCARSDASTLRGARECRKADWMNDEPLMRPRAADCQVDRGTSAGWADDRCIPKEPLRVPERVR